MDSLTNFIDSHSLKVKLSSDSSHAFARAIEEGRAKYKKLAGPALLLGAFCMAVKALIASKIALALSLFRHGGHSAGLLARVTGNSMGGGIASGAQQAGWTSGTGVAAQYPYARTYDIAQDLAYNTYVRPQKY